MNSPGKPFNEKGETFKVWFHGTFIKKTLYIKIKWPNFFKIDQKCMFREIFTSSYQYWKKIWKWHHIQTIWLCECANAKATIFEYSLLYPDTLSNWNVIKIHLKKNTPWQRERKYTPHPTPCWRLTTMECPGKHC